MLLRVENSLRAVRRFDNVMFTALYAVRYRPLEQNELTPPSSSIPLREESIVSEGMVIPDHCALFVPSYYWYAFRNWSLTQE